MKDLLKIQDIQNIDKLENEYDLQRASNLDRELKLMINDNPDLMPLRKKVRQLIKDYEDKFWSDGDKITDEQIEQSEKAENVIGLEQKFVQKRKEVIRKKLKNYDMTQQELGVILGHPKSYMSELMNGVSQFTMKDLVIIHRILGIDLKKLIPTYLQTDTRDEIKDKITRLNKPKLNLKKADLAF
ncbi:MAG: helix-turn-helix domain-containing protein [Bacteroidetes bacterium]|jgi:transcriptional regulator with XRE-family HTH domain|nr:helix-turn-helix domain-containing protein [Bacteroidota bacterium]